MWSNTTCTLTRVGILTGKYEIHTEVTQVADPLSVSKTSLQKHIDQNTNSAYSQAVIGK